MPSTTPDFSTVTCGACSLSAALLPASLKVDGVRALRRGSASPGLPRSAFGQASSKLVGGIAPGSSTGAAADGLGRKSADKRSGASGSLARAAARSRSLREDDVNSRLRFGFAGGVASAGAGGAPAQSRSSTQGGAALGSGAVTGSGAG